MRTTITERRGLAIPKTRPYLPWVQLKASNLLPMSDWDNDTLALMEFFWKREADKRHAGYRSMVYWHRKAHAERLARALMK